MFTKAQPFLEGTDKEKWLERKAAYKELKRGGERRRHTLGPGKSTLEVSIRWGDLRRSAI